MPLFVTKVIFSFADRPLNRGHETPIVVEADNEDDVPAALDRQLKHREGLTYEITEVKLCPIQRPLPEED